MPCLVYLTGRKAHEDPNKDLWRRDDPQRYARLELGGAEQPIGLLVSVSEDYGWESHMLLATDDVFVSHEAGKPAGDHAGPTLDRDP